MTIPVERRALIRYAFSDNATYAWILDRNCVERKIIAKLLNISPKAAMVETYAHMTTSRILKLGLFNVPEVGWLDVEIIRVEGSNRVVLGFTSLCPLGFYLAANRRGR